MKVYSIILLFFILGICLSIRYFGNLLDFLTNKVKGRGIRNGPWRTHIGVGRKNTSRIEKAAIARIGLGANDSDETIYWNAFVDDNGNDLWSENEYQVVFISEIAVRYMDKGFWSITVYGNDKFLVPNPYKKYMFRSDIRFGFNNDSRFSIFLSRYKPADILNWIPLPEKNEKFTVALRCYIPESEMKINPAATRLPTIIKV